MISGDPKDLIIDDLMNTLLSLEVTLRAAGSIQFQDYHNVRDRQLAAQFIKMADFAKTSLNNAILCNFSTED